MRAYLLLEDGSVYEGTPRGAFRETVCEIVFNTAMAGYLEVLSDPSYCSQGVVMTYPIIGNYGVCYEDMESSKLHPKALIVRELCDTPSNFRSESSLEDCLKKYNIACLADVDTRAIVKKLRDGGTMFGIVTEDISDKEALLKKIKAFSAGDVVSAVTIKEKTVSGAGNTGAKVALIDCGVKGSIIKALTVRGCEVISYPAFVTAQNIMKSSPDGIMLSNGPGDPAVCKGLIREIAQMCKKDIPIFAICLGHQLTALANGAKTCRMKYGHRGGNHPVKHIGSDRTYISSQNHGYMIMPDALPEDAQVSWINVNDGSIEGLDYKSKPIFTVQFHPEACSGSEDTSFLFDDFIKMMEAGGKRDR